MQDDIAAAGGNIRRAFAECALQRVHRGIVGDQQPFETDMAANDLLDHLARGRRRPLGIDCGIDDVAGHRHELVLKGDEGREVMRLQLCPAGMHDRQLMMGIGHAAPMARHMLHHRQHATGLQPLGRRPPHVGDDGGVEGIGAVADDIAATLHRHVQHRQAIDIDAEAAEIEGM